MMNKEQLPKVVRIHCDKRGDTYYISSKDLPGLWLWGKDTTKLNSDIGAAIEYLMEHNYGVKVHVVPRKGFWTKLREWLSSILPGSRCGDFEVIQS